MPKKSGILQQYMAHFYAVAVGFSAGSLLQAAASFDHIALPEMSPRLALGNSPSFRALSELHTAEAITSSGTVRRGALAHNETLGALVARLGAPGSDIAPALLSLQEHIDMRRLPRGLEVSVSLGGGDKLAGISLLPEAGRQILAMPTHAGGWRTHELKAQLEQDHTIIAGRVNSSIYAFIKENGGNDQQVVDFADIFAYDIDFQRQVHPGDRLEIVYQTFRDEHGNLLRSGDMLYAAFEGRSLSRRYYRFAAKGQAETYYDENGVSIRKFLMKMPINGARLSSHFGPRRHPVLGYDRMHKGADFAARAGTPILAAGDGMVEVAGTRSTYGKYVRLRHNNGYETAYAHMSRFASGTRRGARIQQGTVIGYVGSTGRTTGPHLHYEVIHHGRHVDPMSLELPPIGRSLKGEALKAFMREKARIDSLRPDSATAILFADISDDMD